jgi:hypothetical protein
MSLSTVCNNDCTCIDCDCSYAHPISFKERKIVNNLFSNLSNPNKKETNPETRKANCSNGKLCTKETCGYRHRLAFTDRIKLNEQFQNLKIQNIKEIKEKPKKEFKDFSINTSNLFGMLLEDDSELQKSLPVLFKKGFKEALLEGKKEEVCLVAKEDKVIKEALLEGKKEEVYVIAKEVKVIKEVPINWADNCDSDDDFYMAF